MSDHSNLALAEYEFVFKAVGAMALPSLSGSLWHRVFGKALHEMACIAPSSLCHGCMLQTRCDYAGLFKGVRPEDAEMMRKYPHVPVPHIFHLGRLAPESLMPGDLFSQNIVLVGSANDRLLTVIRAMASAGISGLGKQRTRAILKQVTQLLPDGSTILVMVDEKIHHPPIVEPVPVPEPPQDDLPLRFHFFSPYLSNNIGNQAVQVEFSKWLMAIVRRVSMLQYFYMNDKLDVDFKYLKHCAGEVEIVHNGLSVWKDSSYDRKQGKMIRLKGTQGFLDLAPETLQPLWPYLYQGQWLHLGKRASMGFGQYQLLAPVLD